MSLSPISVRNVIAFIIKDKVNCNFFYSAFALLTGIEIDIEKSYLKVIK